jgi:hypothetical protein
VAAVAGVEVFRLLIVVVERGACLFLAGSWVCALVSFIRCEFPIQCGAAVDPPEHWQIT